MRALLAIAMLLPSAASAQSPESLRVAIAARHPTVRWVTTAELASWLAGEAPPLLLDARQPAEVLVSTIRGARRIDPDHPSTEGLPRDRRIVVYCSVGWRSGSVASFLADHGFREVYNLEGGIFAWANAGRPLHRGDREVRAVHPYDETWGRMLRADLRAYAP